ncbi:drug/metabolite transporter (DMT)-like permease [Paenibacillus sp. DS2015]|uniref:EamA family transporter n=1 Tax=Paenibacillus sp. DS2015 TaxID=3373917 RepID=UPI003D25D599
MWLLLAALSAICFGLRGIFYHWSSQQGLDRNLMLFGVFFTGAVASVFASFLFGQEWTTSALTGLLMGTFSCVANACMFQGFAVGKSSLIAILTGLPPVVVVVLAYLLWGETLTIGQLFAFVLIVVGILTVRYSNDLRIGNLQGAQWGLLAMLFFGMNDMAGKYSTKLEAELFPTLSFMFIIGSFFFASWWFIANKQSSKKVVSSEVVRVKGNRWSEKRTFLWGMLIGLTNFFGMILIISAFKYGVTSLVSAVVAINVLMILLYTRVFVKVKFSRLEVTGMAISLVGILALRLL